MNRHECTTFDSFLHWRNWNWIAFNNIVTWSRQFSREIFHEIVYTGGIHTCVVYNDEWHAQAYMTWHDSTYLLESAYLLWLSSAGLKCLAVWKLNTLLVSSRLQLSEIAFDVVMESIADLSVSEFFPLFFVAFFSLFLTFYFFLLVFVATFIASLQATFVCPSPICKSKFVPSCADVAR